jgi:formate hydrogenlyase subunit 3/multisubunit Na+/H+ antiporter MnhD subunit
MSGVMLKVAVYGFIRFTFDLLGDVQWQWGVIVLVVGCASALLGVLYALMQHDLKRLLAYHSVENIGIIYMGIGLSLIYAGSGHLSVGALGLIAALYHTVNHALFKSLLFLGAGAIIFRTHERDLNHMGGLIRRMPATALYFLVGCIAIAGLPPLNGFVSEWLTFQTALQVPALTSGVLRAVIPVAAAVLALTGALAAACFVKVYGAVFLGRARSRHLAHGHRSETVRGGMRWGQALLALQCVLLGVLPTPMVQTLEAVPRLVLGAALPEGSAHGWMWLTPVAPAVASYSAPLVLAFIGAVCGIAFVLLRPHRLTVRRAYPWECGFGTLTARMQYTATAFAMPIRRIFLPVWRVEESVETERRAGAAAPTTAIRYHLHIEDRSWNLFYAPLARAVHVAARWVAYLQTGNVRAYLAYSFFTLILMLWVVS